MKKLFTNQVFIENNFLSPAIRTRWGKMVFDNLATFAPDMEPKYGQMAAYYGMIEAGLNESYYRFADKHNKFLFKNFPEIKHTIQYLGDYILQKSGLPTGALPIVPRDKKYFLMAGFKIQLCSFNLYNIHIDTEGLIQDPESIFNANTRAYSCIISIKRTAQHENDSGGDLDIWRERYLAHQMDDFYKKDGVRARSKENRHRVSYEAGKLIVFDSFMPHVVLPFKVRKKEDRRITFLVHFNFRKHTERNPFPHLEYCY
jgi:hypothetical protein